MRLPATLALFLAAGCYPKLDFDTASAGSNPGTTGADGTGGPSGGGGGVDGSDGAQTDCTAWPDDDGDGFGDGESVAVSCDNLPPGYADNDDDCDDQSAAVNPDATEVCNGIDDDCDRAVDDADDSLDTTTRQTWYTDGDNDGYGDPDSTTQACSAPEGTVADNTDCDDTTGEISPGATEVCNGVDDDCDTQADSAAACPCNLERNGDHTYLFCDFKVTWYEAETACEIQDNYKLAVVTDASEQAWLWSAASSIETDAWWWLGLHNQNAAWYEEPSGGFEWVDGSGVSYTNWYPHFPWTQPDDSWGNEDCVHIDTDHGYWNDLDCGTDRYSGTDLYFVCESTVP